MQCPANAFVYNATKCACNPGYLFNATTRTCQLFESWDPVELDSGVDYSLSFPETIFSFDSIKKFTQSQAVFLEATLLMLLSWLAFCFFLRLATPLRDGRSLGFRIRWWISRLDVCFATRHWLEDQKVVKKRKTELGGTLSIASWILFIGLFAALLYQIISKRSVEVHNIRATNAPDLATFMNDLEFNITTISSMSCSQLRGLGTIITGIPGFIGHRMAPLSTFANYSCVNTTLGPTISLRCSNCQLLREVAYVSWQFVDLPNNPASAIGFLFNLSARNPADAKHLSFVRGSLKNGSNLDDKPISFRGQVPNILKFNLFPRIYHNMHELKLIQPLLHEFLPGSSFSDASQLQSSLQNSNDGLINTTLYVNFLSDYIVEIESQNILGPVSFLADLGGLYCISIGIFFYFLVQCEYRIKKLRNEDSVMRKVRNRRKAQERWEKLRKYVMYTWGPCSLDDNYNNVTTDACCAGVTIKSFNKSGSSRHRSQQNVMDDISFSRKVNLPSKKETVSRHNFSLRGKPLRSKNASNMEETFSHSQNKHGVENVLSKVKEDQTIGSHMVDVYKDQTRSGTDNLSLQPPPSLVALKAPDEINMSDLQKDVQNLYEYNAMLTERLIAAQSMLHALTNKDSPLPVDSQGD